VSHGTPRTPGKFGLVDDFREYRVNNGTIRGIVNHRDRTKDPTFAYDAFYRLSAAETAGSHWGLQWTYDRYGNRLSQTASKGLIWSAEACFSPVPAGGTRPVERRPGRRGGDSPRGVAEPEDRRPGGGQSASKLTHSRLGRRSTGTTATGTG
jgi:YD repeat-containing protein